MKSRLARPHLGTVIRAGAAVGAPLLLCACANPIGPIDADYGKHPTMDRLRRVDALDRDRYAPTAPGPQDQPTRIGAPYVSPFEGLEKVNITIEEARAAVLTNNLDLRVALIEPTIESESLRAEEAKFEAVFRPRFGYDNVNQPTQDVTQPNKQTEMVFGGGVDLPLRGGGRASVDYTERITRTTGNPFFPFDTAYDTALTFSLSQPLLRNAGRRVNTHSIRIAAYNLDIAEARTKLEVIRQVASADRTYWRLYAARSLLEVRQKQYELAQAQLERARRRYDAGDVPEIEVTRAEFGAASQMEQIIDAERALLDQQREFKRLVNIPGLDVHTRTIVVPATSPNPVRFEFDGESLTDQALASRMEMLELELRLAQDFSQIEFAKNQALPLFTLDFRYSIPGLGVTHESSLDQLGSTEFQNWGFSVNGQIPIGNESAKAMVQQAILSRLQRLSTKEARSQSIKQEVLGSIDSIQTAWQRIMAARQSVILAARTYEGEQRQFEAGSRTSTEVLEAAARLADQQANEVRALADYEIAQVDLAFATGTLLGAGRVDWAPGDPRIGEPAGGDPTPMAFPPYFIDPQNVRSRQAAEIREAGAQASPPASAPTKYEPQPRSE